jgi:hypothetical protein
MATQNPTPAAGYKPVMEKQKIDLPVNGISTPSEAIIMLIASQKDIEPTEMPPLYETIDPEALDTLFQKKPSGFVVFEYANCEVIVQECENITILPKNADFDITSEEETYSDTRKSDDTET